MDDVGITNGCAMVEVPKSRIRMVMAHSAAELRCTVSGAGVGLVGAMVAMDQPESAAPTSLGEKVFAQIDKIARQRAHRGAGQRFRVRIVRPVNDHRLSND